MTHAGPAGRWHTGSPFFRLSEDRVDMHDREHRPFAEPRRLNLGCGFDHRPGYLNVDFADFHDPDLVADVRDLSVLPSGHYEEVLAFDVLEHLERKDSLPALQEWNRVMAPGGLLHLQVPDVASFARLLRERDNPGDHRQLMQQLFGTQAYTGDFHLAGFTDTLLADLLASAGFHTIVMEPKDQWMLQVKARKVSPASPPVPVVAAWGQGIHQLETDGTSSWRWCDLRSELMLMNVSSERLTVDFETMLVKPDRARVRASLGDEIRDLDVGPERRRLEASLTLEPGLPCRCTFVSGGRRVDAPDDARSLYLQLSNPRLRLQGVGEVPLALTAVG
jgi:predicted SAM-dependent methyltransferase